MSTLPIPKTDLRPSTLCLGTAHFGANNTEAEAHAVLDAFAAHGGNFLDTARVYSNWVPGELNRSERIIGDWLAGRQDRDRLLIATKGGSFDPEHGAPRLAEHELEADITGSLEKLRTDRIDLYWLHRDDPERPVSEVIEALHAFQQKGKIRHYACSNWNPDRISQANAYAAKQGFTGFVANQMRWSIGSPNMGPTSDASMVGMDPSTYALHLKTGIAAIPYSAQARGFFTKLETDPKAGGGYATDANRALHRSLQALSREIGLTVGQIVLAYLWSHPFPVIPIVGCRNVGQLENSFTAVGHCLPEEAVRQLSSTHKLPYASE